MIESMSEIDIKYTICFCRIVSENKVLMVRRAKSPNSGKLNGLGGKIENGEEHFDAVVRELQEEADLDITKASSLRYAGTVTWTVSKGSEKYEGGMHAYIAEYEDASVNFGVRETREGVLNWHDYDEIVSPDNPNVVKNITYFLPKMMKGNISRYHCTYVNDELINFEVLPLE